MPTLTPSEIEQFIHLGYVMVRGAFPAKLADGILPWVWNETGFDPQNRAGWTKPFVHVRKFFQGGAFESVYTPRLRGAVDDVLGAGRWEVPNRSGWWPVRFPGFDAPPWRPPESGWHIDGVHQHHLDSREQGVLGIMVFSEIGSGDGGTAIVPGSHLTAARILAEAEPHGLTPDEFSRRVAATPRGGAIEITGEPGDFALMHPLMLHASSPNTGNRVRIITNKCFPLNEKMNLRRADPADSSPVEQAILRACGATLSAASPA